jgi:hypothetical protein
MLASPAGADDEEDEGVDDDEPDDDLNELGLHIESAAGTVREGPDPIPPGPTVARLWGPKMDGEDPGASVRPDAEDAWEAIRR